MGRTMEIMISKIEEKDTDFAIIRSFIENNEVRELFFNKIDKHGELVKVFHSLMDVESDGHMGESDIVFICENKKEKFAIFIEDKIAAGPQPRQRERYNDRAELLKAKEGYDSYYVFLCAPNAYLKLDAKTTGYGLTISHEEIADKLDNNSFDKAIFNYSEDEKLQKYSPVKNDNVTNFWDELYRYRRKHFPNLDLPETHGPRGSDANWPQFRTGVKNLVIRWKTGHNFNSIDLEFGGMNETDDRRAIVFELFRKIDPHRHYIPVDTGKSMSLSKKLSSKDEVSFNKPFRDQKRMVHRCLKIVEQLFQLAVTIKMMNIKEFPIDGAGSFIKSPINGGK